MKVNRNEPCSCGSKKKYKHCCANKIISSDKSKLGLTVIGLAIIISFGVVAYGYADARYVNIREFDFRKQEYKVETYKCSNPTCTRDHIRKTKIPILDKK